MDTSPGPGLTAAVALGGALGVLVAEQTVSLTTGLLGGEGRSGGVWLTMLLEWGPVVVLNVLGSFCLGLLLATSRRHGPRWRPKLVAGLGTGFLGAFTTISTAALLVVLPLRRLWDDAGVAAASRGHKVQTLAELLLPGLAVLLLVAVLSTGAAALGLRLGRGPIAAGPTAGRGRRTAA